VNEKSCVGCKFLYTQDHGYSNYTVEETDLRCALNRNPNLPADVPWDWKQEDDNWPATKDSRCDRYAPGARIHLDVDGDETVEGQTQDPEVLAAFKSE
jgi:hypothetical protein